MTRSGVRRILMPWSGCGTKRPCPVLRDVRFRRRPRRAREGAHSNRRASPLPNRIPLAAPAARVVPTAGGTPSSRSVFFVSDGTGITAETFGHSLLAQFEGV